MCGLTIDSKIESMYLLRCYDGHVQYAAAAGLPPRIIAIEFTIDHQPCMAIMKRSGYADVHVHTHVYMYVHTCMLYM